MDATAVSTGRDLVFAGVARQAAMVRAGEISPRELVQACLDRIERLDPELNAFRVVMAERALAEADQAAGRAGAGDERPLLGVPIAIKDDQGVAGQVLAWGSAAHGGPEAEDSELVRRLRAAGAIVLGITRTPELMVWPFTETATYGVTRNPWDRERTPGGSSGGTGAAVAAGLVPAGTGSDGGGSIRIPSAYCGLFGLKPQRDRLPLAPRVEAWQGLSVVGFLTRSVADSALLHEAVSGLPYVAAAAREPGRLRIAVSTKIPTGLVARVDEQWRRAVEETAELLRSLGHDVVERDPDYSFAATNAFLVRYFTGIEEDARGMAHPERLERRTKGMARIGRLLRPFLARARAGEAADAARVNAIFGEVDVVMTPAAAQPPAPVHRWQGRGALWTTNGVAQHVPFTAIWNHLGNPAAAVPAGVDARGLPLAVQLVGRPDGEETLLALAAQLEAARPWADRRPPVS